MDWLQVLKRIERGGQVLAAIEAKVADRCARHGGFLLASPLSTPALQALRRRVIEVASREAGASRDEIRADLALAEAIIAVEMYGNGDVKTAVDNGMLKTDPATVVILAQLSRKRRQQAYEKLVRVGRSQYRHQ